MTSGSGSAGAPFGDNPSEARSDRDDRTQEMPLPARNETTSGFGAGATSITAATAPPRPATAVLPTIGDAHLEWTTPIDRPRPDRVPAADRSSSPAPAPQIRFGAGFGGFLAVAALAGIGVGMFALPLAGKHSTDYFHTLRAAATRPTTGHSSQAGHTVATVWWRYGALLGFGVLAFLVALSVATTRLRRTVATLLLIGALATGALLATAGFQTADPDKQSIDAKFTHVRLAHLQGGFWIALSCCAVLALAALLLPSRQRL